MVKCFLHTHKKMEQQLAEANMEAAKVCKALRRDVPDTVAQKQVDALQQLYSKVS